MKISLNWLKTYVALDQSVEEICRAITFLGFEVENVIRAGAPKLSQVVVGEVLTRDKHPNADKLSVCTVDLGLNKGIKTIVCGAQNYKVGDRVPVALPGAVLPGDFQIKQSKIRGQLSDGMMCSAKELGISEDGAGLLILENRPPLGAAINDVLPPGDVVFDIEITPNRPDCLCHLGVARELAAWFKRDLTYPEVRFSTRSENSSSRADLLREVRVDAEEECPLYTATVITGVKIAPSPPWLQDRLRSVGLRPINNIVDVGNFVMLEYNQPLHAFDARKIGGQELVIRRASDGEKIVTLDGKERVLNSRMLVIADINKPLVISGLMGGENSGVDDSTSDIVLEVAYFKRQSIRWTSRRLGLSSDSSYRYERGVDPHTLDEALCRAIDLILSLAGGSIAGPVRKVGGDIPWQREIVISPDFVRQKLGFDVSNDEMRTALNALELSIVREDEPELVPGGSLTWTVSIPSWRDDLDRPIDLVEEILRVYGTERIPPATVFAPGLIADDHPIVKFNRHAADYLVGQRFNECVNYTLRSSKELLTWVSQTAAAEMALANPFVEDQSHLRTTLVMGLLDSLKLNRSRGVAASRLFETGRVFVERNGQNYECAAAAFIIALDPDERSWLKRPEDDFYSVKRHVETVASYAGVDLTHHALSPITDPLYGWQGGQSAVAGDMQHGWTARFGLLNLSMVKAHGIEGKVYAGLFAILPEKLTKQSSHRQFQPFSLYPAALRDLAVIVDRSVSGSEVQKTLAEIAQNAVKASFALEEVRVFDVYQGKGLPDDKMSLGFSLVFRAADRTLTDDEVNAVFQKIQDDLIATTQYQIRK